MERIIQPYGHAPAGSPARPAATAVFPVAAHHPKSAADFLRALRRRAWLVAAITAVVGLLGAAVVARQKAVYQTVAEIKVSPPRFNAAVSVILDSAATISQEDNNLYVMDLVAWLRSKSLVEDSIREHGGAESAEEIVGGLTSKQLPGTNRFQIFL